MKYLSINDSAKYINKSKSSIKRILNKLKQEGVESYKEHPIVQREPLPTGHSKIYILELYLSEVILNNKQEAQEVKRPINEPLNELLNEPLIESLKEQIEFLKSKLNTQDKQIEHYLVLEEQILERFKDLQESLKITQHQLQQQTTIAEQRYRLLNEKKQKQNFESYDDVEAEDLTEQTENLSKHRQDVLKSEMNKNQDIYEWLKNNTFDRRKDD